MDRKEFYSEMRRTLSKGALIQPQVDGIEAILDEWEERDLHDLRWLAYILATAWHETAYTMQPIEEYGKGRGKAYPPYYGRGHVQLTWQANYKAMSNMLGIDLVSKPEMALDMQTSIKIMFDGMIRGMFTGKGLADYFNADTDWINARRIINGTDAAKEIARHAMHFYEALQLATGTGRVIAQEPDDYVVDNHGDMLATYYPKPQTEIAALPDTKPAVMSKIVWVQVVTGLFAAMVGLGIDVPPDLQSLVLQALGGTVTLTSIITVVFRVFFTHKIIRK